MGRKSAVAQTTTENKRAPYAEVIRTGWFTYTVRVSENDWGYGSRHHIWRLSEQDAQRFAERKLAKLVREIKWREQVTRIEGKV